MNIHKGRTSFNRHLQTHLCYTANVWVGVRIKRNLDESPIDYVLDRRWRTKRFETTCTKKVWRLYCLIISPTHGFLAQCIIFLNESDVEEYILPSALAKLRNKTWIVLPLCFPRSSCLLSTKNFMHMNAQKGYQLLDRITKLTFGVEVDRHKRSTITKKPEDRNKKLYVMQNQKNGFFLEAFFVTMRGIDFIHAYRNQVEKKKWSTLKKKNEDEYTCHKRFFTIALMS